MTQQLMSSLAGSIFADTIEVRLTAYEHEGQAFEGVMVYDKRCSALRPGVVMIPNWMGITPDALVKAAKVAGQRYVVFVADLYGRDIRPVSAEQAQAAATSVRGDRGLMRRRAQASVDAFVASARDDVLDAGQIAAVGFCFGGGAVLELARSGAPLKAFVSFHGNLDTPNPEATGPILAPVLALHGASDPSISAAQIEGFVAEMNAIKADWQLTSYGGAVHAFTDPKANTPGRSQYHPVVAARAFAAMHLLLGEVFQ